MSRCAQIRKTQGCQHLVSPVFEPFVNCTPQVKPLLNVARQEDEMKAKEEELRQQAEKAHEMINKVKELEEKLAAVSQERNDLALALTAVSLLDVVNNFLNVAYLVKGTRSSFGFFHLCFSSYMMHRNKKHWQTQKSAVLS